MVVVIIGILVALLLPAINAAIRTAKNAAVSSEISQLATAVENFKSRYTDYPPSRAYLAENGYYPIGNTVPIAPGDISYGALAQRTLIALRKFFPRVVFSTSSAVFPANSPVWYDFNGNGVMDPPYIISGHECLVFFLGGVPLPNNLTGPPTSFGLTGFGKDPANPFSNSISSDPRPPFNGSPNSMYNGNRQPSIFEFNAGRLFLDPNNLTNNGASPGMPGYYDSLGNAPPGTGTTINFYVYFSGYGTGTYDANDVNFLTEADGNNISPIGLQFQHAGAFYISPAPNPYTTTTSVAPNTGTVTFQKAQSYQIFSPGADGLYGVGGQYIPSSAASSSASNPLQFDPANTYSGASLTTDATIRTRERDNLTNFKTGTL